MITDKGNVLHDFTNFIDVQKYPTDKIWTGKNVILGPEGSSKSHEIILSGLDQIQNKKGIMDFFTFNTIRQQEEAFENLLQMATNLGIEDQVKKIP